jgi:GDP-L-fucose synthase
MGPILVTGGSGMVGHALRSFLPDAIYLGSRDGDLRDPQAVRAIFRAFEPSAVIHLAARVGGIKDNSDYLYNYYVDNIRINTNVLDSAAEEGVKRLVALSSTCVYPKNPPSFPITEDMLHRDYPEGTNFGYAFAKRMMSVQIDALRAQLGDTYRWATIFPSNLYGPHDTFDLQRSHVLPAMILKFHTAKKENRGEVALYGTGMPLRQLTYVGDLAAFLADFLATDIVGSYNFANERNYQIGEIALSVAKALEYHGDFVWNGKLDGVMRKDVSCESIRSVYASRGLTLPQMTDLTTGIKKTYEWFLANKEGR